MGVRKKVAAALVDNRTQREKLVDLIDGLEVEQAELVDQVASAPERDRAARVEAILNDPTRRSFDAGAASVVYKLEQATAKAKERLARVAAELPAARDALAVLDDRAGAAVRAEEARVEAERLTSEAEAIEASRAAQATYPAAAPPGAVIAVRRGDKAWKSREGVMLR